MPSSYLESNFSKLSLVFKMKHFEPNIQKYDMLGFILNQGLYGVLYKIGQSKIQFQA